MSPSAFHARADAVHGLPAWLTCAGLLLLFTVPAPLLDMLGINYTSSGGLAIAKVHPGTDLIVAAVAAAAIRAGNPLRYFAGQGLRFPGSVVLLGVTALLVIFLIKVERVPFTPMIDTFVLPAFLFPLLTDLSPRARHVVECGLHAFLCFNAALGITEFLAGWHLIPMNFADPYDPDGSGEPDWRAAGLLGHPLESASTAGIYAVILAMGFGRSMPAWLRGPAIGLQAVSLAAFGGRTALVMTSASLGVLLILRGADIARGRAFDRRTAAIVVLAAMAVVIGTIALASSGFFDQLLLRFSEDNGSAKSRAAIFDVLRHFSWQELWLGPDQDHVATVLHLEGLEVGIESFWLGLIALCGIWMSVLFFIGLAVYMADVLRHTDIRALVPLAFYVVVISGTVSLTVKSTALAQFVTMIMILMPAVPARSARRAVIPHRWRAA